MLKVLFIVITYNAMPWVEKCLGSVKLSNYPGDIYIVDNGSCDGTQEYIRNNYPEAIFIQNESNQGFGKANNLGFRYALDNGYDYAYLLNQDAWIFPDTIEKLVSAHKKHPEYGILSPMQCQANMHYMDNNFVLNVCYKICRNQLINDLFFNERRSIYEVPNVMAAHWLISRECIIKVGGFSPTFPHYGEDDNYCDRTRYFNYKIGIVPKSLGVHDREDRVETKQRRLYMYYISILRTTSRTMDSSRFSMALLTQGLKLIMHERSMQPIYSIYRYLRNRKTIIENRNISMNSKSAFL